MLLRRFVVRLAWLIAAGLLPSFAAAQLPPGVDLSPVAAAPRDSGLPAGWSRRAVFMEVLVRAYQDSNGDGIGDLNGLISRLDYLQQLGIRGLWLMPIFKSSDRDHGYAVVNYREIESDYGSLADFDRLIAEAHRRGIAVIVDYVMNHASSSHPLFEDAYDRAKSPWHDWFIWSEDKPRLWTVFDGDPWREGNQRWYYAAFDTAMPDFNLRNPAVLDFHLDNLRFWLNRGVDGFRFDAVGALVENGRLAWENQPENHVLMKRVRALLASYGERFLICEAPSDPAAFAAEDSCGSSFAFGLHKHILSSVKVGRLRDDLLYQLRTLPVARMGTLLANHDYFAGARLRQQFDDDDSYKLAAATLLTLPGVPFLYYGEEVGLAHSAPTANNDQAIRGPMSWSGEPNAGFSGAQKPFRSNVSNWKTHNVAAEEAQPQSLLNWYRALIALRNAEPALSIGSLQALSGRDVPIFAFVREHAGRRLLVLLNFAHRDASTPLPAGLDPRQWAPLFPAGATLPFASAPRSEIRMKAQQVLVLQSTS